MDPLSAIGLAAAVLQFASFAVKTCDMIYRFHQDNYDDFHEGIFVEMTRDFANFSVLFGTREQIGLDPAFSQNQEALDSLIGKCQGTATELMHIFSRIAQDQVVKDNNVNLDRRIVKVKLFFKKVEIDRLLAQLKDYRSQLVPYMLACLHTQLDALGQQQNDRFGRIDRGHSQIVEVVAVVKENLDLLNRQNEQLRRKMDHLSDTINTTSILRHEQAMAAFLTFQNGEMKLLTRTDTGNLPSHKQQQSLMTMRDADSSGMVEDFMPTQTMVLDSLYFRQFYERLENVRTAHAETYEWIFCPPEAEMPWGPFVEWLESGTGCYWISGKPGSGKSTLMKFIAQHRRTREALEMWAGRNLICASFFFWNLGSPLQKSQVGLLRSLLHEILTQQPQLISVVTPDLWRLAAKLPKGTNLDQPSLTELKRWLQNALDPVITSLKFFFLIDGIDEFEGDHNEIVELINDIVKNNNVKILLSSRLIPVCEDSFSHCPSLRLQDLTRGDIQKYARDHLSERLEQRSGDEGAVLIDEITDRSHGVFLWVILVVRSLVDGLRKGDTIQEMRGRLDELPSDLKDLYEHMIRNLEPRYQRQGSELFQLLLKAHQVQSSAGFPLLLQVVFCNDHPERVLSLPIGPLDPDYRRAKCDETNNRIHSRSCGLVESRQFQTGRINSDSKAPVTFECVDFIHRTVVEFLRLPEVWIKMMDLTATPKYDPSPQLFRSCIMLCKTLPKSRGIDPEFNTVWHMMDRALIYASMAEDLGAPVPRAHLKELDNVLMSHWADIRKCFSRLGTINKNGHWARGYTIDPLRQEVLDPNDFASIALFHGLRDYLEGELAEKAVVETMDTTRLLFNAIRYIGSPPWDMGIAEFNGNLTGEAALYMDRQATLRVRWANMAILLLKAKGDPNQRIAGSDSAWSIMLSYVTLACGPRIKPGVHRDLEAKGFANLFTRLLAEFIKHGADLSFCVTAGTDPAWKLIDRLFSHERDVLQEFDPWMEQPTVVVSAEIMKLHAWFKELMAEPRRGAAEVQGAITVRSLRHLWRYRS